MSADSEPGPRLSAKNTEVIVVIFRIGESSAKSKVCSHKETFFRVFCVSEV